MAGSGRPDIRRVRVSRTYTVAEIVALLDVHPNTVRRWLREGLKPLDDETPVFVHGAELRRFLSCRRAKRKQKCAPTEMRCFRCSAAREPVFGSVVVARRNQKTVMLRGICARCGGGMWQAGSVIKLEIYSENFGPITTDTPRLLEQGFPLLNGEKTEDDEYADMQPKK